MPRITFDDLVPSWVSSDLNLDSAYLIVMVLPFGIKKSEKFFYIYGTKQELQKDKQILELLRWRQCLSPEPYIVVDHFSQGAKHNISGIVARWAEKQIARRVSKKRTDLTYVRHAGKITKRIKMPYVLQYLCTSPYELTKKQLKDVKRGIPIKPKVKMVDLKDCPNNKKVVKFLQGWLPDMVQAFTIPSSAINCRCASTPITTEDKPNAKV